jgi:hypothetical protein
VHFRLSVTETRYQATRILQPYFSVLHLPTDRPVFSTMKNSHYLEQLDKGVEKARNQSVVICGLVRDLEEILPLTLWRMEKMGEMFGDYQIVIYENDSKDHSLKILQDHTARNPRIHLLSDCLGDPVNPPIRCLNRVERMATYRNQYREYVSDHFSHYDLVIVVDMDLPGGWDLNGISHSLAHNDWDFIGSYGLIRKNYLNRQKSLQYDAWAYREFGNYNALTTKQVNYLHWPENAGLIPVYSCFGGMGIYRMEALVECEYRGGDCEHVSLHRQMRKKGMDRLFLNPRQVTDYGVRDSRACRWLRTLGLFKPIDASLPEPFFETISLPITGSFMREPSQNPLDALVDVKKSKQMRAA